MAVVRNTKSSLVEAEVASNSVQNGEVDNKTVQTVSPEKIAQNQKPKKKGFIGTTIEEVKKVSWPSFDYVLRWSLVILLFTGLVSLAIGAVDHIFTGSVKFVDCTSPQGRNQSVGDCGRELGETLTFRR